MNAPAHMIDSMLPWDSFPQDQRRFQAIIGVSVALALVFSAVFWLTPVPKLDRRQTAVVPERLARVMLQKQQEQQKLPEVKREEKKEEKPEDKAKDKPEEKAEAKPEVKPEAAPKPVEAVEPKAVADAKIASARAKAQETMRAQGFDALAGLADEAVGSETAAVSGQGNLIVGGGQAAGTSRNLIGARAGTGSGGLGAAGFAGRVSSGTGGGIPGGKNARNAAEAAGLAQGAAANKLAKVNSNIADAAAGGTAPKVGKDGKVRRSEDSIRQTFQRFAGALNGLYQRALRDNPALQGTVTLKLSVAPDGSVTACEILASELNDPALEAKIIARVKSFNFGTDSVEAWDGKYTLNFFEGG